LGADRWVNTIVVIIIMLIPRKVLTAFTPYLLGFAHCFLPPNVHEGKIRSRRQKKMKELVIGQCVVD
jgi:hypothetical protein